jgi:hypothetical protein
MSLSEYTIKTTSLEYSSETMTSRCCPLMLFVNIVTPTPFTPPARQVVSAVCHGLSTTSSTRRVEALAFSKSPPETAQLDIVQLRSLLLPTHCHSVFVNDNSLFTITHTLLTSTSYSPITPSTRTDTMSSATATTSTSAALQTTPPTSQSTASSGATPSHPAKSLDHSSAVALQTRDAAVSYAAPQDAELCLEIKCAVVLIGALIERWLLMIAMDDIFTFPVVASMLWFVFGGHRNFAADDPGPPPPTLEPARPPDASQQTSGRVESWLGKLRSSSESTGAQNSSHAPRIVVIGAIDFDTTIVAGCAREKNNATEEIYDAEHAFLELSGMAELYLEFEVDRDVLTWMNGVVQIYYEEPSTEDVSDSEFNTTQIITDDGVSEELEHAASINGESLTQDDSVSEFSLSEVITGAHVPKEPVRWLAALLKQHEYPVFRPGGVDEEYTEQWAHNYIYPLVAEHISETCTDPESWITFPGRPAVDDAKDITFMFGAMRATLPAYAFAALETQDADYWKRYRCWKDQSNLCRETLVYLWHELHSPNVPIKSLADVIAIDAARVRQFRPECPMDERGQHGPDSAFRPYLTDQEAEDINERNWCFRWEEEVCQLKKDLAMSPDHQKLNGQNPALAWFEDMNEAEQLDRNAYDLCNCGQKAAELVNAYRSEKEHDYDPEFHTSYKKFPTLFNAQEELLNRWASKISGKESTQDARIPRSQKILQCCELHEMVSNNIFVMVDTAYCDIIDIISNPGGPLPVPGVWTLTYPERFRTRPDFVENPYDDLPVRCIHGRPHPGVDGYCQSCSEAAHAWYMANHTLQHNNAAVVNSSGWSHTNVATPPGYVATSLSHHYIVANAPAPSSYPVQQSCPRFWFEK